MIAAIPAGAWFLCAFVMRSRPHAGVGWLLAISGIPMLGLVTWQNGPVWGFIALAAALVLLRTPFRTVRAQARRAVE